MTDNLLLKLEEKTLVLLTELDDLRKEVQQLRQENNALKTEKGTYLKKLQNLISLLDALELVSHPANSEAELVSCP